MIKIYQVSRITEPPKVGDEVEFSITIPKSEHSKAINCRVVIDWHDELPIRMYRIGKAMLKKSEAGDES